MKRKALTGIATVLAGAAVLVLAAGCTDSLDVGADRNTLLDGDSGTGGDTDADSDSTGEATQFCWAGELEMGDDPGAGAGSMSSFEDGSFIAAGDKVGRFTAEGTLMWMYTADDEVLDEILWLDSVPSDGTTVVIRSLFDLQWNSYEYLTRIDADGQELWSRQIAAEYADTLYHNAPQMSFADVAPDGSVVVAAAFDGEIVLGEGEVNETTFTSGGAGVLGTYVARFDATGALVSAVQLSIPLIPLALVVTHVGDIIVAGIGMEDAAEIYHRDFGDITLLKLSAGGLEQWTEQAITNSSPTEDAAEINETSPNWMRLLPVNDDAFVLATGFTGELLVLGGDGAQTYINAPAEIMGTFIARYSADGDLEWVRAQETSDFEDFVRVMSRLISVLPNGDLFVGGRAYGSISIETADDGLLELNDGDDFTAIYSTAGDLFEVKPYDFGPEADFSVVAAAPFPDDTVMFAAYYAGTASLALEGGTVFTTTPSAELEPILLFRTCADGE